MNNSRFSEVVKKLSTIAIRENDGDANVREDDLGNGLVAGKEDYTEEPWRWEAAGYEPLSRRNG